jgi:hypothetical protein
MKIDLEKLPYTFFLAINLHLIVSCEKESQSPETASSGGAARFNDINSLS